MGQIIYRTGSLFETPPGAVLVHSCNARGVWGAGVAAQMKARFPDAFEAYRAQCALGVFAARGGRSDEVGRYSIKDVGEYVVASLITSDKWGSQADSAEAILRATEEALQRLLTIWAQANLPFHSPRLNSGLFRVPWERTEAVLREAVEHYDVNWTVWTP